MAGHDAEPARPLVPLFALIALFYLGWLKFLAPGTTIYLIDYAQRALVIALAWPVLRDGFSPLWPRASTAVIAVAVFGVATILLADEQTQDLALRQAVDTWLYDDVRFPPLDNPLWEAFDLSGGLLLVAVSEELVFRRLFRDWWDARHADRPGGDEAGLYFWSALVFGLLHLPQGLADTAFACVWGVLLMYLFRRSGSLPLVVAVHFVVDIWYFT